MSKQEQTFNSEAVALAISIADLVIGKQHDYGKNNILGSPAGPEMGILVRLWDKFCRARNLMENQKIAKNESLRDTFVDIVGYSLISLMLIDGTFDLPFQEE